MAAYNVDLQTNYPNVAYNWPGGSGKTIYTSGCCPASVRNILVNLCSIATSITEMCSLAISCGARVNGGTLPATLLKAAKEKYGGFTYQYTTSDSTARAHVVSGGMALCHTTGSNNLFSTSGHFVAMAAATSSRVTIIDPYVPANKWTIYNRSSYITTTSTKGVVTTTVAKSDESFDYYYLISKETTATVTDVSKIVTITATKLNVRSGPSTSYSVIGSLTAGATATVTGTTGSWYRITYGSGTGYICAEYTTSTTTNTGKDVEDMTESEVRTLVATIAVETANKAVSSWAAEAFAAATTSGILDGTQPQAPLTREQLAVVLGKLGLVQMNANPSSWAADAFQAATDAGVLDGTNPHGYVTREMLAQVLQNCSLIETGGSTVKK